MNLSNANLGSSISAVGGFLLLLLLPFDKILGPFGLDEFKAHHLGDILKNCTIIIFVLFLIKRSGCLKISGVNNFIPRHPMLLIVPLYFVFLGPIMYVVFDYEFYNIKTADVLILLTAMISVGISEEVIFRGFVLPNLIKGAPLNQPLIVPILLGSFLFGLLHFLNLFRADTSLPLVLSQVTYATFFGVAFGIVLLRTGSLLPLGLLHGIINFSSSWDDLPGAVEPPEIKEFVVQEAILSVIVVLPFLFYTLKQLPKIDRNALLQLYEK
ncbi:MAG: CPBP family intramembrane glutamic endopeptidase [Flavobacteriaceae bacterium]